jgi:hypothetical protein
MKKIQKNDIIFSLTAFLLFFLNNWTREIIREKLYLYLFIALGILIFFFFKKKIVFLSLLIIFLLSLYSQKRLIWPLKNEEVLMINQRRSFYKNSFIAKSLENKANFVLTKYKKNLFQVLDPNYYFFASHPRERAGVNEIKKFPWVSLFLFLPGVYLLVKNKESLILFFSLSLVFLISFFEKIDQPSFFVCPFVVYAASYPILEILNKKISRK